MRPHLDDGDVRLYLGDALSVLADLPDASVDCIVTSPPYFGLRDYGTGTWEGGQEGCDHHRLMGGTGAQGLGKSVSAMAANVERSSVAYRETCGKCGARRVDQQIGLEPTPDDFVATLVEVFRACWRVLAEHGTCWVNLGDSYSAPGMPAKNLLGMPWRVALALQADGWILRRDIIWSKANPMPESASDRCTSSHEYLFHLTKRPRYWYDADAVREPNTGNAHSRGNGFNPKAINAADSVNDRRTLITRDVPPNPAGRNLRSVWEIATQPTPEAHFATYPEELVRRCILAGCPLDVCRVCGKPRERLVERTAPSYHHERKTHDFGDRKSGWSPNHGSISRGRPENSGVGYREVETLGWSDCGHNAYRRGIVLDPFVGSGTTAAVARRYGRHAIGVDLSAEYLAIAARRLRQLSLDWQAPAIATPSRCEAVLYGLAWAFEDGGREEERELAACALAAEHEGMHEGSHVDGGRVQWERENPPVKVKAK